MISPLALGDRLREGTRRLAAAVPLGRVVEDNPNAVPHAGADAAHTVTEIDTINALRSLHWTVMDGEGHRITLAKRNDLGAALHARTLFRQDKFASREIDTGL